MPRDTFSHRVQVAARPAAVWDALQRAETWQGFGMIDEVADVVATDSGLASFSWTALVAGRTYRGSAIVDESRPLRGMSLTLESAEMSGVMVLEIQPEAGGTTVAAALTAQSRGVLAGLFWGPVASALGGGLRSQLDEFAASFG